jgi:hypothetical protein
MRSAMDKPEKISARPVIIGPDGSEHPGKPLEADLETAPRARLLQRFQSFPLLGSGEYEIRIEMRSSPNEEWQRVGSVPVEVRFREAVIAQMPPQTRFMTTTKANVKANVRAKRARKR